MYGSCLQMSEKLSKFYPVSLVAGREGKGEMVCIQGHLPGTGVRAGERAATCWIGGRRAVQRLPAPGVVQG